MILLEIVFLAGAAAEICLGGGKQILGVGKKRQVKANKRQLTLEY